MRVTHRMGVQLRLPSIDSYPLLNQTEPGKEYWTEPGKGLPHQKGLPLTRSEASPSRLEKWMPGPRMPGPTIA